MKTSKSNRVCVVKFINVLICLFSSSMGSAWRQQLHVDFIFSPLLTELFSAVVKNCTFVFACSSCSVSTETRVETSMRAK